MSNLYSSTNSYKTAYSEADYIQMFSELGFNLPKDSKGLVSCHCHTDKNPSMSIDLQKGIFNCFSCGYHGRIDIVYKQQKSKAFTAKTCYSANSLRKLFKQRVQPKIISTGKSRFEATYEYSLDKSILKNWLNYRGIKASVADSAGAFYGNVKIKYLAADGLRKEYSIYDRIIFPIYDINHQLSSLEMRFPFTGTESKYFKEHVRKVLYPKCSSTNLLYDQENLNRTEKLYVLEGLMDCLAFRSLTGIKNSTAIFGACLTNYQLELLNTFPEICYVYNNDTAGLKSLANMKSLYTGSFTRLKPIGNYDDVGEMAMNRVPLEVNKWLQTQQ